MAATKILKVQILVPSITLATELFITLRQREGPHVMYITSSRLYSPGEILQNESWIVRLSKSLRDFPPPPLFIKIQGGRSYSCRYCSIGVYELCQRQSRQRQTQLSLIEWSKEEAFLPYHIWSDAVPLANRPRCAHLLPHTIVHGIRGVGLNQQSGGPF